MPTIPHNRNVTPQLAINRNGTFVDVTDYLEFAEVELGNIDQAGTEAQGSDGLARRMSFTLRNDRIYMPNWPDTVSKDETYVIGQDTTVIEDEYDSAEKLIDMLFDTAHKNWIGDTFHPRDKNSDRNIVDGSYDPLVWPGREVYLRVAIREEGDYSQESGTTQKINHVVGTGDGTEQTFDFWATTILPDSEEVFLDGSHITSGYTIDYDNATLTTSLSGEITINFAYFHDLFAGLLGDNIEATDNGATITCDCRDYAKLLQNMYIDTIRTYGSDDTTVTAEEVIQQIIDDNFGTSSFNLYTPEPSGFAIREYEEKYRSVWDAIQRIATQRGWFLGFLFDIDAGEYRLTFKEPPRNKDTTTADYTLTAKDDFYVSNLAINDLEIRNKVKVSFRNANTGEKDSITVEDQASIDAHGLRPMEIGESNASQIDTPQEATDFGNYALQDLKDIDAQDKITMPIFPQVGLFSGINVDDPRVSSTVDFFGVDSVRHWLDVKSREFRTEVLTSGKVHGAKTRMLAMQTRPGAGKPIEGKDIINRSSEIIIAAHDTPFNRRMLADYICTGNNDQEILNRANNSLPAGGKITMLEGTYDWRGQAELGNDITLEGQGNSTKIIYNSNSSEFNFGITNADHENGNTGIVVKNLSIDGNNTYDMQEKTNSPGEPDNRPFDGIGFVRCSDSKIKNVKIKNGTGICVYSFDSDNIEYNSITASGGLFGIYAEQGGKGANITNCFVYENIWSGIVAYNISNTKISGCKIYLNGEAGIWIYGNLDPAYISRDNSISNNTIFANNQAGEPDIPQIVLEGNVIDSNIQNNTARAGDETNEPEWGIFLVSPECVDNLVSNNDLHDSASDGAIVDWGTNTSFGSGNRMNDGTWSTNPTYSSQEGD